MATFLSADQRALLDAALDRLIPPLGALPGAGQAGTADYLDAVVGESPRLARPVRGRTTQCGSSRSSARFQLR